MKEVIHEDSRHSKENPAPTDNIRWNRLIYNVLLLPL